MRKNTHCQPTAAVISPPAETPTAAPALRKGRQDATLLAWLGVLPSAVVARRPALSVCLAWSMLIAGDLDAVELRLRDAEEGLRAAPRNTHVPRSGGVNEFMMLQALAHQAHGQLPLALLSLERVLCQA